MPPSRIRTQFDQGLALFHRGEYEKAIAFFEEVVFEEPDNSEALYNLSCCYARTQKPEEAILYLDRAVKLNPHCQDWAREDREFEDIRDSLLFQQITASDSTDPQTPSEEPDSQPDPAEEPEPPDLKSLYREDTGGDESDLTPTQTDAIPLTSRMVRRVPRPVPEDSGLPPCKQCDGLVSMERRPRHTPILMLFVIYLGILSMALLFLSLIGLIGIPVTLLGLYFFSRIDDTWVCQNCGAVGPDCGQPIASAKRSSPRPVAAKN